MRASFECFVVKRNITLCFWPGRRSKESS